MSADLTGLYRAGQEAATDIRHADVLSTGVASEQFLLWDAETLQQALATSQDIQTIQTLVANLAQTLTKSNDHIVKEFKPGSDIINRAMVRLKSLFMFPLEPYQASADNKAA